MKKAIAFILCLAVIAASLAVGFAADKATGTTLRLNQTEGNVTVKNASGKTQTTKADMKLYSGYQVKTAKKSYAYISLDDSKAIKLDASTEVEITKSGKKLEVIIKSGQIFFDVTEKMKSDESLNIRTSTMVTGIHGTMGVAGTNQLLLLEGNVKGKDVAEQSNERLFELSAGEGYQGSAPVAVCVANASVSKIVSAVTSALNIGSDSVLRRVENHVSDQLSYDSENGVAAKGNLSLKASEPEFKLEKPEPKSKLSITDLSGFVLTELAGNKDRIERITAANEDSQLAQDIRDLSEEEAQAIRTADEVLADLFVPIDSSTFADGTPNTVRPQAVTNTAVDMTKPLDILREDGSTVQAADSDDSVIIPPQPPVVEDYYEPAPPAAPKSDDPETFSVVLPQDIMVMLNPDSASEQTKIAGFRLVSGGPIDAVPNGGSIIIAVDYNRAGIVNEYDADSYSVLPNASGASIAAAAAEPEDDNIPENFVPKYYIVSNINSDTNITYDFYLNNNSARTSVVPSVLSDKLCTKVIVNVETNGGGMRGLKISSGQVLELYASTYLSGECVNDGTITVKGYGSLSIERDGQLTNNNVVSLAQGCSLDNDGTIIDNKEIVLEDEDQFPIVVDMERRGIYIGPHTVTIFYPDGESIPITVRHGGSVGKYGEMELIDYSQAEFFIKDSDLQTRYDITQPVYGDIAIEIVH